MAPGLLHSKNIYFVLTAVLLFTGGAPVILPSQDKAGNTTEKSERLTEAQQKEGTIKGTILDYETKKPLEGVKLVLLDTDRQASSDAGGRFVFSEIQVGTYRIECSLESFYSFTRSDILVRPRRTSYLNLELYAVRALNEEVSVTADYFPEKSTKPGSRICFHQCLFVFKPIGGCRAPAGLFSLLKKISFIPSLFLLLDAD